jgi:DNA-binding LacI/PurR family transcriptional regulator
MIRPFRNLSAVEQLAAHLRGEIERGAVSGTMPGVHRLAGELGVSPKSVVAAVALLERDGLLRGQGPRRPYLVLPPEKRVVSGLRVAILPHEMADRTLPFLVDLQHLLQEAGHVVEVTRRCLLDLDRSVDRVARYVGRIEADAWIVVAGTREILQWFVATGRPTFAIFGRRRELPIAGAGPDKVPAVRKAVRRLMELGHRQIVFLAREDQRRPHPGATEFAFLEEMANHGVATGGFNLPDWEETPDGFHRCLDRLFAVTPPTALILDEAFFLNLARLHLATRGIRCPEQVSLLCCDTDPSFAWQLPRVAHIRWDSRPIVRQILRWVKNTADGKKDRRQSNKRAEFIEGGTIGPVR